MNETEPQFVPCPDCGDHGGTCILIHDGSPHGREHCRHAQWRDCPTCSGSGRTEPQFDSCDQCGRPIWEHMASHDEPAPGLTEATFAGVDASGFYCPRMMGD